MDVRKWQRSACEALTAKLAVNAATDADLPESSSSALRYIRKVASGQNADYARLAPALSALLQNTSLCAQTARLFWPVVPDIMARWIGAHTSEDVWEARFSAVAAICGAFPHLWPIANAFLLSSPFLTSPLAHITSELTSRSPNQISRILLAYHRFLAADPALPSRHTWPHEPLHTIASQHPDIGVRLLAVLVLCRQMDWSEVKRLQLEQEYVGDISTVDVPMTVGAECKDGTVRDVVIDGWLLGIYEGKRIEQLHTSIYSTPVELTPLEPYLSPRIALIGNALFTRSAPSFPISFVHVPTQATTDALTSLIPILQTGSPALLSSLPSSGKTHLLHHLSTVFYPSVEPTHRILSIPLADTTIDVKSLIGTYVSSPTKPGTFEWMEGALAKAVRAGRWVVLDDIDRAGMEMLVTVAQLARSLKPGRTGRRGKLQVPGRPDIEAGDGFALFATRSTRPDAHTPEFFGHHHFTEVTLNAPTEDDILAILSAQFGRVPAGVIATLVRVWQALRPLARIPGPVKPREIGLRDLEKWCARVQRNLPIQATIDALQGNPLGLFANPVFQDEVLLEAVDVFMASFDSKPTSLERKAGMIAVVAEAIGMDDERAMALIDKRRPTLEVSTRQLLIGRTVTPLAPAERKKSKVTSENRPYALTKPSLVLLERVAASTALAEPTLLVGETGTGKTTAVQYIANAAGKPLTVLNLSMQTESSDLLGGFKPIDASASARLLHAKWQKLFIDTFSMAKPANGTYLEIAAKALAGRKWARCAELWSSSAKKALDKLVKKDDDAVEDGSSTPRKKRKTNMRAAKAAVAWQALMVEIADFDLHHVKGNSKLVFSFIEGPLVKAIQSGEWILLDEVNLASQETLEAIATILESPSASLVLTERGDVEPIKRHAEFRLFACMNPATDVGKKDLPPSLRTRFTELYVPPPDDDREALISIVTGYIGDVAAGDRAAILDVAEMYLTLKRLSADKEIVDGANSAPHFSMRTLARALSFAVETAPLFGLRRGLWEGCLMAFTMSLDTASIERARQVCQKYLLGPLKNAKAVLSQIPQLPSNADADDYVRFGAFWLKRGPLPPVGESRYVITPSVQSKLSDLARVILTHRYPVLIQGPTSAGKTSAVEFLARQTGHRFVRINNHEHTDIQEYLGTYVTDPQTGSLVFQEGLLVTAVRQGHWIVLDELNLAPTDVLEALNRLLDDNRELVIPETQEVIKPHPNFILFATQNPPGLYAGRKVLSRAFRNRFLEVHFDDVPKNELETILCQRCQIAPSYAKKIVQVFEELRHRRQASRVFESKSSFATLRDLFRWAERGAVGYQQLAEDGYMLLAERGRNEEDKEVIKGVIEDIMKVKVDQSKMYDLFSAADRSSTSPDAAGPLTRLPFDAVPKSALVWTKAMQRLFTLVASALAHKEPVLLVGETGCGKTSVCDIVAAAFTQQLVGVNCHQNMETADLLGSQRPVRNRLERKAKIIARLNAITPTPATATDDELVTMVSGLIKQGHPDLRGIAQDLAQSNALFEWSDGPLVHAMHAGNLLLLDEVSLADDSVLERLNSVLEPGRTLVLAEKGGSDIDSATIVAADNFHVVATMNPGGDFGKKELSPALRNRFTEIWVPALTDRADLLQIIGLSWKVKGMVMYGSLMLDFMWWFCDRVGDAAALGLRDILAWVDFMNRIVVQEKLSPADAFHHGGQMVVVDGLESLSQTSGLSSDSMSELRTACLGQLTALISASGQSIPSADMLADETHISLGGFAIHRGPVPSDAVDFRFNAPTTAVNAMRVLRGCQLPKAILLEGSPGVGKTSLVNALASVSGHRLQRINLSDQTDLIDLFGSDLPVEGGQPGEFQWRDAAFLDAMQKGDWVLLDEMNLASQTVLEGLNAVLDHRGTVYIPELGRSFDRHPDFRVFAAQNPLQQGGGRKGLPKSFLNRFTKVYLSEHTAQDLFLICQELHPMPTDMVEKMIRFNEEIRVKTMITRTIGREGSPWEFNLRDLFRWFGLLSRRNGLEASLEPVEFLRIVYLNRFRNPADRQAVQAIFEEVFGTTVPLIRPAPFFGPSDVQIGHSTMTRGSKTTVTTSLQHAHLDVAESVLKAVEMGWLVILAGDSGAGKRHLLQGISQRAGRALGEFAMHPGVDTSEILGSFEQQDMGRLAQVVNNEIAAAIRAVVDHRPQLALAASDALQIAFAKVSAAPDYGASAFSSICTDILSSLAPISAHEHLASAQSALAKLRDSGAHLSGFAWIDGQLVKALRDGGWFLISEANLCSASVLDRLNSLCENNGSLVLSEKGSATGQPEIIRPHAGFRLFMTYDPRYGELSRAMRNRGIELHVARSESAKAAVPAGLAIESSSDLAAAGLAATEATASCPADGLASTLRTALPLLNRIIASNDAYASTGRALQLVESALSAQGGEHGTHQHFGTQTLDGAINLAADRFDAVFRMLQLYLRLEQQHESSRLFLQDADNAKTILVRSATASAAGRRKDFAGKQIQPFLTGMREALVSALATMLQADGDIIADGLDGLATLLDMVDKHARAVAFDYSATNLLSAWIREVLDKMPALSSAASLVNALGEALQLTSGHAQTEVWNAFRETVRSAELDAQAMDKVNAVQDAALRRSLLDALVSLKTQASADDIVQLQQLIDTIPQTAGPIDTHPIDERWQSKGLYNMLKLRQIANPESPSTALLLGQTDVPVDSLADLQILSSSSNTPPALTFKVITSWLMDIWSATSKDDKALSGPADLLGPTGLRNALRFESNDMIRLHDLPALDGALRFTIDSVLAGTAQDVPRNVDVLNVATTAIAALITSCTNLQGPMRDLHQLRQSLDSLPDGAVARAAKKHLASPLKAVSLETTTAAVGDVYLGASAFLIELYVTNFPIDPSVRRILEGEYLEARATELTEELEAVEAGEIRLKGISDSHRRDRILARLAQNDMAKSQLGPLLQRESDPTRLAQLFAEVHAFLGDIMSESSISSIRAALHEGHSQAMAREWSLQAAAEAFILRMSTIYADMDDLVRPIILAVLFTRMGMRCLARDLERRQQTPSQIVNAALAFPLARTVQQVSAFSQGVVNSRQALLSAMSTVADMLGSAQQAALAPVLHAQLDGIYQLWSDARTEEQQDEQAKESLYRVKKTDIEVESDVELEERELAEMFPSYENLDEVKVVAKEEEEVTGRFTNDDVSAFHVLVQAAASQSTEKVVPSLRQSLRNLVKNDFDHRAYGDDLDRTSIAYQMDVLHRRLTATKVQSSPPNFYLDANEPEIRKAHELVSALHRRLKILIDDWPEQMVLQHIRERADKFLALDIRSPVALVLAALEQLLQHTDDWEPYASKDNSLRVFRGDASAQIINWRRLELSSWNRLLDDQASQYVAKDDEWTVRLYGSLISAATSSDDITKHIHTILPMLSTFLQHSTMGHFVSRLDTLDSLAKIARQGAKEQAPAAANLAVVSTVLSNIIANTRLIAPKIESHILAQRTTIDRAIKDFIKLASWKDVNVHALRASAQKSHRQLHKNIRKFRELLSSPVAPFLGDVTSAIGQEAPQTATCLRAPIFTLEEPTFPSRDESSDASRPAHLVNLADTFARFARLHSAATDELPVKVGEDIDGMAVDIIETAAELAKATPSALTKENAKVVNNLASRKRKAFADMLKALRTSGFSNNVRADAMARQQSTTWLAQRPVLNVESLPEGFAKGDVQGVVRYHTKLGASMVALRAAFNGHNPDIASQDLQRGIGFAESIYACALAERDRVHGIIDTVSALTAKLARLGICMAHDDLLFGARVTRVFADAATASATLSSALFEVIEAIGRLAELDGKPLATSDTATIREYAAELQGIQQELERVLASIEQSSYDLVGDGETAIVTRYQAVRSRLISYLDDQCDTRPKLRYLYKPVLEMAQASADGSLAGSTVRDDSPPHAQADGLIQSLLVITQSLARPETKEEEEAERPHIPRALASQRSALDSMHVGNVMRRLDAFIEDMISHQSAAARDALARVLPFLQRLAETYAQSAAVHIYTTKSTYKLCYVVGRIMLDLAQKGFCKPQEESDSKDDGDADGQMTDGTGMGAGSGDKNVSNEIEEEGQVEGLQGEKEDEGEREEKEGDDDAFEMENDFEGDLEDGKEAEEGEGEEDGEEEERDDHAGDVDPLDPGAVDEKFWGDEEEQEGKDGGDELMDQQTQEAGGESEMTAKDEQQKQDGKKDAKEKEDQEMGESAPEGADGPEDKFEEQEDGEEQDGPAEEEGGDEEQAKPDQPNVNVPEGDKLDLPEDINLDGDESGSEMEAEDDIDLPVDEHDDDDRGNDQGDDIDMASEDDGEQAEDAPAPTGVGEDETTEQEEAMAQNLDLSASNDAQAQEAAEKGQGAGGQSEQQLEKDEADKEDDPPDVQAAEQAEEAEPQGQGAAQEPSSGPTDQNQGDGTIDSSGAPLPNDPSSAPQQNRSLGDIMQEIRRRQDEILAQQERDNEVDKRDDAQAEASGQVEYLHDNDEDQGQQALGAAGEEERQRLEELDIVDEDDNVEGDRGFEDDMDVDEEASAEKQARPDQSRRPEQPADAQPAEKALTQSDVMGGREAPIPSDQMDIDAEEGEAEAKTEVEEKVKEEDVELTIVDQPAVSDIMVNADEQWRYYAGMTSDLSYALCEQLRLILEPTLATRLQGDFRTGKRLNMRKIIPYIASEYTKDKIWLRRTKPSRREYQVLLSLDDSRSMSESHSVDLAYQTLALVSQALNKLEVGQIGIAKFGEGVDILHPFGDAGFTDADGAKVMSSFKFDQQKTDVAALVERTLTFLAESRQKQASTSAPDLWQLQIIISDGVCQDHHRLRTLLRRALEERVMIVFLVIDSLRQSDTGPAKPAPTSNGQHRPSILSMQTVEYKNVNGEMQLEMTRYLDTFPFEYYVVLRDVEALPGVLSDTLRQWMARVSQSQE